MVQQPAESLTATLFLAVVPPPEIVDAIDLLPTKAQRGVRFTRRTQWHITIKFLGETNTADALDALEGVDAQATEATFGPEVVLLGSRVVMVPVAGLDDLAHAANVAFSGVGEDQGARDFVGHVTLARLKGAPLRDPGLVSVLGAPMTASFGVESLALIKTEVGPEGTVHTQLAQKVLAG